MPKIISPYAASDTTGLGDVLGGLAETLWGPKASQAELYRQKANEARRQNEFLPQYAGALSAGADPGEVARLAIMAGQTGQDVSNYGRYVTVSRNPNALESNPVTASMAAAGTPMSSTPAGFAQEQATKLRAQEIASNRAFDAAIAAANNTPVAVIDETDPYRTKYVSQSEAIQRGLKPVPTATQAEGVIRLGGMPTGYAGFNPQQQVAAGVAVAADKVGNWFDVDPNGNVTRGRTVDGKTDLTTGQPLSPTAQVRSSGNAGDLANQISALQPGTQVIKDVQQAVRHADDTLTLGGEILKTVAANPTIVGPAGNVRRLGQEAGDLVTSIHSLTGGSQNYQASVTAAKDQLTRSLGPNAANLLPSLFDKDLNSIQTLNGLLIYKAAAALGQSGTAAGEGDIRRITALVGQPDSWMQGPTTYQNKVATLLDIISKQRESDLNVLKSRNIAPGSTAAPAPTTATPTTAAPVQGTTSTGVPFQLTR